MENENGKRNGVQLPYLIVDHKRYKLTDMLDRELSELKIQLELSLNKINRGIQEAKAKVHTTGEFSDPAWFSSIKRIRGIRSAQIHGIDAELSERKKNRIKKEDRSIEYWFLQAAKAMLHQEGFRSIMEAAKAMRIREEEEG